MTTPGILRRPITLADLLPLERITPGVRDVALVVGGAALTALAAQLAFTVPWTPVPYTLQTGAVLLVGTALGSARGALVDAPLRPRRRGRVAACSPRGPVARST